MKVVAVCDSFKGSLGSADAGEAVARGIRKALQGAEVIVLQLRQLSVRDVLMLLFPVL